MKLAYKVYYPPGEKEKNEPPVVMLHGMLDSKKTWMKIAPNIAQNTGRIVYTVDARNHGESAWTDVMNWDVLVDDVETFLRDHRIPKAVLVGHSMGGRTSLTFALKHPQTVDKLIVEDMSARTILVKNGKIIVRILQILKETVQSIPDGADETTALRTITDFLKLLVPGADDLKLSGFHQEMIPIKKQGNRYTWQTNLDVVEDFLTTDKLYHDVSNLGVYRGDAMFLYGTKSLFRVNEDPLISKLFPHAVKVGAVGSNHLVHLEYTKKFEDAVCNFINNNVPLAKI